MRKVGQYFETVDLHPNMNELTTEQNLQTVSGRHFFAFLKYYLTAHRKQTQSATSVIPWGSTGVIQLQLHKFRPLQQTRKTSVAQSNSVQIVSCSSTLIKIQNILARDAIKNCQQSKMKKSAL